jgi:ABC-type transporter Mla subunit MlaD
MAATTDDKSFRDQFNADIDRLGKLLANLDPAKPVVFGFVVTASAPTLRTLAARPDVRLVDIFARHEPESLQHVRGLRPDETVRAGEPRTRPV